MRWRRWLKYGKAKLDQAVRDADAELDRKEEQLAAERAGRPWLTPSGDTPTLAEVKARIEDTEAVTPADTDAEAAELALEMEAQRKAAEQRLAEIRKSLDLPPRQDDTH